MLQRKARHGYSTSEDVTGWGVTDCPGLYSDCSPTTTCSFSFSPVKISAVVSLSRPKVTSRFSILLSLFTTSTVPWPAADDCTDCRGKVRTLCAVFRGIRTDAYIPGTSW